MTESERRRMAASMGVSPDEYLKRFPAREPAPITLGAATSRAAAAPPPGPMERGNASHAAKIDLLIRGMGITSEEFALWRVDQLIEGKRRQRAGERLTETQTMLLAADTAAPTVTPIVPTAEDLALAAEGRRMRAALMRAPAPAAAPPATSTKTPPRGRTGTIRMLTGALEGDR